LNVWWWLVSELLGLGEGSHTQGGGGGLVNNTQKREKQRAKSLKSNPDSKASSKYRQRKTCVFLSAPTFTLFNHTEVPVGENKEGKRERAERAEAFLAATIKLPGVENDFVH